MKSILVNAIEVERTMLGVASEQEGLAERSVVADNSNCVAENLIVVVVASFDAVDVVASAVVVVAGYLGPRDEVDVPLSHLVDNWIADAVELIWKNIVVALLLCHHILDIHTDHARHIRRSYYRCRDVGNLPHFADNYYYYYYAACGGYCHSDFADLLLYCVCFDYLVDLRHLSRIDAGSFLNAWYTTCWAGYRMTELGYTWP